MEKEGTLAIKIKSKKLNIKNCKGIWSAIGLMFSKLKDIDGALIYANNVWMPFIYNDLDLFFLDKSLKILEYKKSVPISKNPQTWKIYQNNKASYCLEIKHGVIKNPKKTVGKKVKIVQ